MTRTQSKSGKESTTPIVHVPATINVQNSKTIQEAKKEVIGLKLKLDRRNIKLSKVAETYVKY